MMPCLFRWNNYCLLGLVDTEKCIGEENCKYYVDKDVGNSIWDWNKDVSDIH